MMRMFTCYEVEYLKKNAPKCTVKQLACYLKRNPASVRSYLNKKRIDYIKERQSCENPFGLTNMEFQVMELIAQGCSNREITNKFFIQLTTLKTHIIHIYQKLGFTENNENLGSVLRVRAVLKWQQYKKECENGRK